MSSDACATLTGFLEAKNKPGARALIRSTKDEATGWARAPREETPRTHTCHAAHSSCARARPGRRGATFTTKRTAAGLLSGDLISQVHGALNAPTGLQKDSNWLAGRSFLMHTSWEWFLVSRSDLTNQRPEVLSPLSHLLYQVVLRAKLPLKGIATKCFQLR